MLCLLAASVALLVTPAWAGSGLYKHTDSRGVVHFTDRAQDGYEVVRAPRGFSHEPRPFSRSTRYDGLIQRAAGAYGVPAALVKAVIAAESAFEEDAVSRKGAMGLMQLMPATAADLGVERPFHADDNVFGGTRYLRRLHDRYGTWTHTLAAYNAGPTAVERYRGVPPYAETQTYVRRVLSYYRRFHGDFPR